MRNLWKSSSPLKKSLHCRLGIFFLILLLTWVDSRPARAMGSDKKVILTASAYGVLGGALLGLIAVPSTRSSRSVLIGGAVGLYLGLAAGFYHLYHREDPENPLSPYSRPKGLSEADGGAPQWSTAESMQSTAQNQLLQLSFQVYSF